MVIAGLMVALGILFPMFTAHAFGLQGTILLPMHLPVLLCGLLCGYRWGAAVGVIVPVLSSAFTGMPPIFPMLPIMLVQLVLIGLVGGLIYLRFRKNIYLAVVCAILAGWAGYGIMFQAILLASGAEIMALSVLTAMATGIPGIIIQVAIVPPIVLAVRRSARGNVSAAAQSSAGASLGNEERELIESARASIRDGEISCAVIAGGKIVFTGNGRGVATLLALYDGNPQTLNGAIVVDKIIGKAAAMILIAGGCRYAFGEIMSVAGREILKEHGVTLDHGRCVEIISNITGNGICPIERSVIETDDVHKGVDMLRNRILEMRAQGAQSA
jgi:hypothetical protein